MPDLALADLVRLALGFAGLVVGGEMLVRGAVSLAQRLGLSPLVIGLTLVGFGTSAPELVTSLQAALAGSPGIAVGNVVGSNIANILLILGATALLAPIAVARGTFGRDGGVLLLATAACVGLALTGSMGRAAGGVLAAALLIYVAATVLQERRRATAAAGVYAAEAELVAAPRGSALAGAALALAGLAATILGARLLVGGAIALAGAAGVSEAVIGVTVVAVGTSMPELVTAIVAVRKGQGDVAFGNVLGSNIFNILGILGVTTLVRPLAVPAEIAAVDIWVMAGATLALLLFAVTGWRIGRREGAALLAAYAGYAAWLAATAV